MKFIYHSEGIIQCWKKFSWPDHTQMWSGKGGEIEEIFRLSFFRLQAQHFIFLNMLFSWSQMCYRAQKNQNLTWNYFSQELPLFTFWFCEVSISDFGHSFPQCVTNTNPSGENFRVSLANAKYSIKPLNEVKTEKLIRTRKARC